jgi:hypothetical protein
MNSRLAISRRTVLKGMGASLALPMLEAMQPLKALAADATKPPLRMLFFYVPGGVNVDEWMPKNEGADYEPRYTLEALAPVRQDVLVLSGLNSRLGEQGANGHPHCRILHRHFDRPDRRAPDRPYHPPAIDRAGVRLGVVAGSREQHLVARP